VQHNKICVALKSIWSYDDGHQCNRVPAIEWEIKCNRILDENRRIGS